MPLHHYATMKLCRMVHEQTSKGKETKTRDPRNLISPPWTNKVDIKVPQPAETHGTLKKFNFLFAFVPFSMSQSRTEWSPFANFKQLAIKSGGREIGNKTRTGPRSAAWFLKLGNVG